MKQYALFKKYFENHWVVVEFDEDSKFDNPWAVMGFDWDCFKITDSREQALEFMKHFDFSMTAMQKSGASGTSVDDYYIMDGKIDHDVLDEFDNKYWHSLKVCDSINDAKEYIDLMVDISTRAKNNYKFELI